MSKIFLNTLHLVADSPLSAAFVAIPALDENHWLLPLHLEAVLQLDLDYILKFGLDAPKSGVVCNVTWSGANSVINVSLKLGGEGHSQPYPVGARSDLAAGNALDIRVWPNFHFLPDPALPEKKTDRHHFFRVRQEEAWEVEPVVLARIRNSQGESMGFGFFRLDVTQVGWSSDRERFRQGRAYSFPAHNPVPFGPHSLSGGHQCDPVGLYFEGRGLLLLALEPPHHPGGNPDRWRIGIDFGTSNSCVACCSLMKGTQTRIEVIRFLVHTAALLANPSYDSDKLEKDPDGERSEGAASALDFPYCFADEVVLTEQEFFPSQLVTRRTSAPRIPNFMIEHGLALPVNVVLRSANFKVLLKDYPPIREPDTRVFRLIQDLKWSRREFRKPFLWHLYKMIVFHAARNGARVVEAAISFPRAFKRDDISEFAEEVRSIFQDHGGITIVPEDVISESAAVQRWLAGRLDDYLVFDVGGGTTDFLGIIGASHFQASYYLAAGCLNQYFQSSPRFRSLLQKAIYEVVEISSDSRTANRQREQRTITLQLLKDLSAQQMGDGDQSRKFQIYSHEAFFGLLSMLEEKDWVALGERLRSSERKPSAADARVIHGFFLTLVVLYAGLASQAARLMRQHGYAPASLRILMVGNGSRFCRLLGSDARVLNHLMQEIFRKFGSDPEVLVKTEARFKGKPIVAEGLVSAMDGTALKPAPVLPDKSAAEYLEALGEKSKKSASLSGAQTTLLADLIQFLDRHFKDGEANEQMVIPHSATGLGDELAPLLDKACELAAETEKKQGKEFLHAVRCAKDYENKGNADEAAAWRDSANAMEPAFITRLRCLLELIQAEYSA